jgi:hypothetical protein
MIASMGITRVGWRVRRIERKNKDNEVVEFAKERELLKYLGTPAKCAKSPGPSILSAIANPGCLGYWKRGQDGSPGSGMG